MKRVRSMMHLAGLIAGLGLVVPSATWAASYSDTVLATPGLVGYYRMNEDPAEIGDALINVASPGALDGMWGYLDNNPDTLPLSGEPGPGPAEGLHGLETDNSAAYFAGSTADDDEDGDPTNNVADQMDLGDTEDLDNEFATISLFMRTAVDGNDSRIFTTLNGAVYPFRLVYGPACDASAMVVVTDGEWGPEYSQQTTGAVFGDDQWHHLVAVRNGDDAFDAKLYVDGSDISGDFVDPCDSYGATGSTARIGARHGEDNFGWGGYEGLLDEFAYWNRALTAEEVLALYEAAVGDGGLPGDYNGDGQLDAGDLDLQASVGIATQDLAYDLNQDGLVDFDGDRVMWLHELKGAYVGDANLDGEFDSADFVEVFQTGLYEKNEQAGWAQGDWDGDLLFDSADFVAAFTEGGYESGPFGAAVQAVPEPASLSLLLLGFSGWCAWTRRRQTAAAN